MDYTAGCVNFRDAGEFVNFIADDNLLPEGKLYRGGSIDYVLSHGDIGEAQTIINLRNSVDTKRFDADYFNCGIANKIEKYNTGVPEVRTWLNNIMAILSRPNVRFPVLIHCLSGKDRTGMVTAAILLVLGIDREIIVEEYLLSDGRVDQDLINLAIDGMNDVEGYFNRVDLDQVRENILH